MKIRQVRGMDKVIIVRAQESIIVRGIGKKLEESGYDVGMCWEKYNEVDAITSSASLFLIYLSNNIVDDNRALQEVERISELLLARAKPVIVVGDENHKEALLRSIASIKNHIWLSRPVDLNELPKIIDKSIARMNDIYTKKRLLIVDDDPSFAKMIREWLKEGFDIDIVTGGMQAISYLAKRQPDLILLDYEMPIVDGPQVFRMLRSQPETAGIPIVFLTGVSSTEGVSKVLELKPDGYVLKSTSGGELMMYITKLFDKLRDKNM